MSEREEARTCVRCGVTDTAVLDLDTGSACHPEWRDCVAALRYFLREQDSDLFTLRQKLTTAERALDEARREREALKIDHADALDAYRQMYESERDRAERERDEARRERDGLAEWKRDAEEHARMFIGFGQSYENEPVFSIMGGANQNYSYYVGQCERLQEELEALRHRAERAERVVGAARRWLATNDAFFAVSIESRSFGSDLDKATNEYGQAVRNLTAELRALDATPTTEADA